MLKRPRPRTVRPIVSREEYLLRGLTRAFPGGEWVDSTQEEEAGATSDVRLDEIAETVFAELHEAGRV